MPIVSEEGGISDTPKLQFSVVESTLFAFHQLVKKVCRKLQSRASRAIVSGA